MDHCLLKCTQSEVVLKVTCIQRALLLQLLNDYRAEALPGEYSSVLGIQLLEDGSDLLLGDQGV